MNQSVQPQTLDKRVQIGIDESQGDGVESASELSSRLGFPLVPKNVCAAEFSRYVLYYADSVLSIRETAKGSPKALFVDFCDPTLHYRQKKSQQPEAILKALGPRKKGQLTVLDTTAGWGLDSFIMASSGCNVQMLERSVVLYALLADGMRRASESMDRAVVETVARMSLRQVEARDFLLETTMRPDVVYLDPMFPERKKSALVKKNMRLLQELLGHDEEECDLLEPALQCAKSRVIVKRPRLAPTLLGPKQPDYQLEGKSNRFDVYLIMPIV